LENIRQAVERAKADGQGPSAGAYVGRTQERDFTELASPKKADVIKLDVPYLQRRRIVGFDGQDPRSRSFDILRTEVQRSIDLKNWRTLAVTSPTANCGKTLTAINLALSLARQSDRQIRLVDLDLRKPHVAASLGLNCHEGVRGVLEGRVELDEAIFQTRVGDSRLEVLPTQSSANSSDLVASTAMKRFLQNIPGYGQSRLAIIDLPPLLGSHDVISILPHVDCVLLVAAVGVSTVDEVVESFKYLQSTEVIRFVLNKAPQSAANYVYY